MHMRSHYPASGARWAVFVAMVAYAMGVGVAPALHFAEDGAEVSAYLAVLTEFHAADDHAAEQPPPPPSHHVPDGVDCLFCQVLSAPADPGLVGPPALETPASAMTPTLGRTLRPEAPPSRTSRARAPPHA